ADLFEAFDDPVAGLLLSLVRELRDLDRQRPHAGGSDHRRRARRRVLEVAAHAARGLVVEDVLGSHGAEDVYEVAHRLALPLAKAFRFLGSRLVAELPAP